LNEDNFNSCGEIILEIYVEDWSGNFTVLSDIYFFPNENPCSPLIIKKEKQMKKIKVLMLT
jgi:hypothetical protein